MRGCRNVAALWCTLEYTKVSPCLRGVYHNVAFAFPERDILLEGGGIWLRQIVMKLSSVLTLLHPAKIRSANRSFLRTIAYLVVGIVTVDYIRKTMCVICEIIVCKRQKICKLTLRWWGLGLLLYGLLRKTNCVCGFLWDLGNHINASRWASYCSCSVRSPSRM